MTCGKHQSEMVWVNENNRNKLVCTECRGRAYECSPSTFPMIKWGQNFWRDRPYNEREKSTPFGIAKRPNQ